MLIEHQGKRPRIHPTAYIAPTAVISGEVEIGAECRILHGAVITAVGAPVRVGSHCVVMEHAVIRGSGGRSRRFPTSLGDYVLVGPHAYLVGCAIEDRCFIATTALVFNGAHIKRGCTVTLQDIVHIGTALEEGMHVPLQHVAIGTPATMFQPGDTDAMMAALQRQGFAGMVFGIDLEGKSDAEVKEEYAAKYVRALAAHLADRMVAAEHADDGSEAP
jgi:carbonic anhydrase/acetyltransferase-like protein (isoleucine patch superfamily)